MQRKGSSSRVITDPSIIERSVVLALLDTDHESWWSRSDLEREHHDVDPVALADAIERLREGEVIEASSEQVQATRCTRHLGTLGMICA